MKDEHRIGQRLSGALSLIVMASLTAPLYAKEPFEGVWAKTQRECRESDRPTSRTLIDLDNRIDGKSSPLFDQYEHHCLIKNKIVAPDGTAILTSTCFEFWENFSKNIEGTKTSIKLIPGPRNALKINGTSFRRCPEKRGRNR
jgi:hypothetical protein